MRLLRYAPWLLLGPITGPLLALAWAAWRAGRPLRAMLCLSGIVAFWIGAPALLGAEIALIGDLR